MERITGKITGWHLTYDVNGVPTAWLYDQDATDLTSVKYSELQTMLDPDTNQFLVGEINGVPVWEQLVKKAPEPAAPPVPTDIELPPLPPFGDNPAFNLEQMIKFATDAVIADRAARTKG